ncbi:MAG: DNA polymerase I [Sulfurospirillum sp.]|nr:DNA polymerase I [Sulfurospirillum sp.]
MKTLTIIDTFGFFFRNYYALPNLRNKEGFPTGLITGFANFIYTLKSEYPSDYIFFALDSKGKTFRHDIDPNYKATRQTPPQDLLAQLPIAISWIEKMGFQCFCKEGYEADDVIASAVRFAKTHDIKTSIVTHDKDLYQLIDAGVVIYDPAKKIEIDKTGCYEKFGVYPQNIGDYLSLIGDSADNIPGVRGIGPKGAKKLLDEFRDLEHIYENLQEVRNPRAKKLLEEGRESAFLSKKLVLLDDSLQITESFEHFSFPSGQPLLSIAQELAKYELRSLLSRIGYAPKEPVENEQNAFEAILLDTKEKLFTIIHKLCADDLVAFDTETDGLDVKVAKIVGFSFALDTHKAYYVPIAHNYLGVGEQVSLQDAKEAIAQIFTCKLVGQNLKYDFAIVANNFGLHKNDNFADTMVLAWLLDPQASHALDAMAKRYFDHDMVKFKDVVKKGTNFSHVSLEDACVYASEDAWMTLLLYEKFQKMVEPSLLVLAKEVEYPFVQTLLAMEDVGILVDKAYFQKLETKSKKEIERLESEIYVLCGCEFNLNSPKQLGVVLFETLALPTAKKTKTGYSTDESVLSELVDAHPCVAKILEYREIYKLQSTYIKPLLKLCEQKSDNRVHTSFLQTGTSTGRLSSKDPNLQNIPVKTELGREIRHGFIAKEGFLLVGIDYSQIELRLLAHFSQDKDLLEAFNNNLDIHRQTARKLFGEALADSKRNVAKSINFGLLYGMGAKKLSQTLGVSQAEAKGYIQSYFDSFETVKSYLQSIVADAKKSGFVQTLLGRRRYFDFANANAMQLAMYERESVNTLFQGSAADLIKLAMLRINGSLCHENAKLLLQIHDELIFEVKEEEADIFAQIAAQTMEDIYMLQVKLKVSVAIGKNWGELK